MKTLPLSLALLASAALAACAGVQPAVDAAPPVTSSPPPEALPGPAGRVDSATGGAMALLPVLDEKAGRSKNFFYSPASIEQAFGVLYLGTAGETRTQMQQVLPPPASARGLETNKDGVEVRLANALWLSDKWRFQQAYVTAAAARYDATATALDFTQAQVTAGRINDWADKATQGLIPKVIGADAIDPDGAAFITNALYFDGLWANAFDESNMEPFLFGDGEDRPFRLMTDTFDLSVVEQDGWVAVRLPYRNKSYAMDVVIPRERKVMEKAPSAALLAQLATALGQTKPQRVTVRLPQFEIDYDTGLVDPLRAIGLTLPFDQSRADLSAMAEPGQRPLFVDKVTHNSKLQVFDIGTKAAAVTVMRIIPVGARFEEKAPYDFRADRPFMVVLRDLERASPLFVGRIADPQAFELEMEEPF